MPQGRYFIDTPFTVGDICILPKEETHHLTRVMRAKTQDLIELVNGKNCLAYGRLLSFEKQQAYVRIETCTAIEAQSCQIQLYQALPRLNRLDSILEKVTELGAHEIYLFPGDLSEKKDVNLQRCHNLLIAALKQCGRLDLPQLKLIPAISTWKKTVLPSALYYGDVTAPLKPFKPRIECAIGFVNGPESGFSKKETQLLRTLGAIGVKLHPYILRTDTAPLVALSLIQQYLIS